MGEILITGVNRGLGLDVTTALFKDKDKVYCTGRSLKQLDSALRLREIIPDESWEVDFLRKDSVLGFIEEIEKLIWIALFMWLLRGVFLRWKTGNSSGGQGLVCMDIFG